MEDAEGITARRLRLWNTYHEALAPLAEQGFLKRPVIPESCEHNAHMYYILLPTLEHRSRLIEHLKSKGIHAVFHYVPLHDSEMGRRVCRTAGNLDLTTQLSERLLRLPFWLGMEALQEEIIQEINQGLLS